MGRRRAPTAGGLALRQGGTRRLGIEKEPPMNAPYKRLALAISINTVVMFFLTYALIDSFDHFYPNVNRGYMAVLMAAPMVIVMLLVMGHMYEDRKINTALYVVFGALFVGVLLLARSQTPIGDVQFLRSMIPHHSSAILMCERSTIRDPEIASLCVDIVKAQEKEIAQMKEILKRY
jgi:hypothetical protein